MNMLEDKLCRSVGPHSGPKLRTTITFVAQSAKAKWDCTNRRQQTGFIGSVCYTCQRLSELIGFRFHQLNMLNIYWVLECLKNYVL